MLLDKQELEKLSEKYDDLARENFEKYQETGSPSTLRTYQKYDDLSDALRVAVEASDDHEAVTQMKLAIVDWVMDARNGKDPAEIIQDMDEYAVRWKFVGKEGKQNENP